MPQTITPISLISPETAEKLLEGEANVEIKPTGEVQSEQGNVTLNTIGLYVEDQLIASSWSYTECADELLYLMNEL